MTSRTANQVGHSSQVNGIIPGKFSKEFSLEKPDSPTFTIDIAKERIEQQTIAPDAVVLPVITNDVKSAGGSVVADKLRKHKI